MRKSIFAFVVVVVFALTWYILMEIRWLSEAPLLQCLRLTQTEEDDGLMSGKENVGKK